MVSRFRSPERGLSQMWQRESLTVQNCCRQAFVDLTIRDDVKYPVKELSRSLSNPQESDFDNLKHLLNYVNQTRDFIFVMEPQIPAPNLQGLIPVEIVSFWEIRLGRMSKIAKINEWLMDQIVLSQYCFNMSDHKLQCHIHQQKRNWLLWLRQQSSHLRSSTSSRNSNQRFFQAFEKKLKRCQDHCQDRFFRLQQARQRHHD